MDFCTRSRCRVAGRAAARAGSAAKCMLADVVVELIEELHVQQESTVLYRPGYGAM